MIQQSSAEHNNIFQALTSCQLFKYVPFRKTIQTSPMNVFQTVKQSQCHQF